jgi:hypothetical protein
MARARRAAGLGTGEFALWLTAPVMSVVSQPEEVLLMAYAKNQRVVLFDRDVRKQA